MTMSDICGDPYSGIGCPIPGCTHRGPDADVQFALVQAERDRDQAIALLRQLRDHTRGDFYTGFVADDIDESGLLDPAQPTREDQTANE
jgi:hypothetical protein